MLIICDRSIISTHNRVIITNDLLITAGRDSVTRTMNTRIVASDISDATIFAYCFIGNRIIITDDFCIAAVSDFIVLSGNIRVDILYVLIRIRDGIPVAICYSRIIRGPADAWRASPRQGTGGEGQGDDAGQGWGAVVDGRLAALMIPLCKF